MARILHSFLNRSNNSCKQYPDAALLIAGLQREEPEAIQCLSSKTAGAVYKVGKGYQLVDDDIEELHCDCIMLFIEKIRNGQYEYRGFEPGSFVVEIAKRKAANYYRKAGKLSAEDISELPEMADEPEYGSLEQVELLHRLLAQINENCRTLIRLKYFEERKDKEVIELGLTQYSTVDALKNHRARCMKMLCSLASETRL